LLTVRETPRPPEIRERRPTLRQALAVAPTGTAGALAALISGQALLQSSYSASQQLLVLRLIQINPGAASAVTGLAFAAAGVVTALAGVSYSRGLRWMAYRLMSVIAAVVMAVGTITVALLPTLVLVVAAFVVVSFMAGVLIPAISSMIGLEAPPLVQATIYGFSSSAISVGFGGGPLVGGLTASRFGITAGFVLAAGLAAALAVLMAVGAREPAR
jgi:MFS family permease